MLRRKLSRLAISPLSTLNDYSSLEYRRCLAGITFNSNTGQIEIDGGASADRAIASEPTSSTIRVELSGFASQDFSKSTVTGIKFWGRSGNDYFQNLTNKPSFAYGHAGLDTLLGGGGVDNFQGGTENDTLNGGGGNDYLRGNEHNDTLFGGLGNDQLFGGDGNDQLFGQDGHDLAYGELGDDALDGGAGNDRLDGFAGADRLFGQTGNDLLYGGDGADQLEGGANLDQLFGGTGNDQLRGGNDADQLFGGLGDDSLFGDAAADLLSGQEGNDAIDGGSENDTIWGDSGNDSLEGSDGNDTLYAGEGDDLLEGGSGSDKLYGGNGNDRIYGDGGDDLLYGEAGIDGLFGGVTGTDRSNGGSGADRFLIWGQDVATDFNSADGKLNFLNRSSAWNDAEIKVLDEGLHLLHVRVGTARIIRDSLDNDPVIYSKWSSLGGSLSTNYLKTTVINGVTTYDRELKFADWNENNSATNDILRYTAIHEIGHSWDSVLEINNRIPGNGGLWNTFLSLSGWRDTNPHSSEYTQSLDGEWWYRNTAEFVRYYSRANPREDWSTVWEIYFDPTKAADRARVQSKVNLVSVLFDRL